MSLETEKTPGAKAAVATEEPSLLDQIVASTKATTTERVEELLTNLLNVVEEENVYFDKNVYVSIHKAIDSLDQQISRQLSEVMHNEELQKLEGSWRGIDYLYKNSTCNETLKIRVFQANKEELTEEFQSISSDDDSTLFKRIYEDEFGSPGGTPYGALIGDYQISNSPDDMDFINKMAGISAAAFCPFLTAPAPQLFGMDGWGDLVKPRNLATIFETPEFATFRSFREKEDSRYVSMVMPRVLSRLPYGEKTKPTKDFNYEELIEYPDGSVIPHEKYCWMNPAYVMGTKITNAFTNFGWCTAIRGLQGGGKVEDLPTHVFMSDRGELELKCPTEIGITDRREKELSDLGFMPLSHYKDENYAVFFGGQTCQKPKKYDQMDAQANAEISARLPYILAVSRIAHYLKVMARDKIGSFMEVEDMETDLNRWIQQYVNSNEKGSQAMKAKFPLREAQVQVAEIPGKPGFYHAVAHLRPWLQFEQLTASLRLVAQLPAKGK